MLRRTPGQCAGKLEKEKRSDPNDESLRGDIEATESESDAGGEPGGVCVWFPLGPGSGEGLRMSLGGDGGGEEGAEEGVLALLVGGGWMAVVLTVRVKRPSSS